MAQRFPSEFSVSLKTDHRNRCFTLIELIGCYRHPCVGVAFGVGNFWSRDLWAEGYISTDGMREYFRSAGKGIIWLILRGRIPHSEAHTSMPATTISAARPSLIPWLPGKRGVEVDEELTSLRSRGWIVRC